MNYKNILIKVSKVETNIFTDVKTFFPVMMPESDKFVYSEFLNIIDDKKNFLGTYLPGEEKVTIGNSISELKIGEVFTILDGLSSYRRTSRVIEIITPNLFLTQNSLYFIKDEKFQIQQNRNEKLNQIIND